MPAGTHQRQDDELILIGGIWLVKPIESRLEQSVT